MPNVIVTGGAGYIGSHACKALALAGYTPITIDNLETGWSEAVKYGPFEKGDLLDRAWLAKVMAAYQPMAIMHFAALSQVGESVTDPGRYWRVNVEGALNMIEVALAQGCKNIIFSSTCATYGDQEGVRLSERSSQHPSNAYGCTKRAIEEMLKHFGQSHGLNHVIFRYFNVAGADPEGELGEFHQPETHLIPLMLDAIDGKRQALTIHGTDYDTPDGTCIRDYVHVMDLVDAHVLGLKWLEEGKDSTVFNLGTGNGFSVRQVVDQSRIVTNKDVPIVEGERRLGDAVKLVSGSDKAIQDLGWQPHRSSLKQMITDAWRWHQNGGYEH